MSPAESCSSLSPSPPLNNKQYSMRTEQQLSANLYANTPAEPMQHYSTTGQQQHVENLQVNGPGTPLMNNNFENSQNSNTVGYSPKNNNLENPQQQEFSNVHTNAPANPMINHNSNDPVMKNTANTNANIHMNISVASFDNLILRLHQNEPTLFPSSPTQPITTNQIDVFTQKLWLYCLNWRSGELMNIATSYGAVAEELKLRALAKVNILPSSWFLRERVMKWLRESGRLVDDEFMAARLRDATKTMTKHILKRNAIERLKCGGMET
jgi:hypothetical protein